jgi:tetratricopeptide (TPR) repeat protein
MGNIYYETGDLESALTAYHQGLEVELAVLDAGNPNVCVTYTNIAEIHKQRSEFDKALEYYQKVLDLQQKHDSDISDVASTLSSIGMLLCDPVERIRSILFIISHYYFPLLPVQVIFAIKRVINQECLRLRRETKGDMDEDVAATSTHIALVLLKMERHDIALEVLTEAYRIRTVICKPSTRDLAFTLYNIALIHHH